MEIVIIVVLIVVITVIVGILVLRFDVFMGTGIILVRYFPKVTPQRVLDSDLNP